jgi:hypothetical protein
MKNYKPKHKFGHNKLQCDYREFDGSLKEWKLYEIRTLDKNTKKSHHYATGAVTNREWWWTMHNN